MITHAWQMRVDYHAIIALVDVIGFKSTLSTPPSSWRNAPPLAPELAIAGSMRDLKNILMDLEA